MLLPLVSTMGLAIFFSSSPCVIVLLGLTQPAGWVWLSQTRAIFALFQGFALSVGVFPNRQYFKDSWNRWLWPQLSDLRFAVCNCRPRHRSPLHAGIDQPSTVFFHWWRWMRRPNSATSDCPNTLCDALHPNLLPLLWDQNPGIHSSVTGLHSENLRSKLTSDSQTLLHEPQWH